MIAHLYPSLATCLALLVYAWTFIDCGRARLKYGVKAPATTGAPEFERRFRVQQNTVEQLVLFLPSLWIFSGTVSPVAGLILGLIWVVGRVIYGASYARRPESRGLGFMISTSATLILLLGGFGETVWIMVAGGI